MSRHTVRLRSVVVGWSDLEHADPFAGSARGLFRPGVGYDLVQPIFDLYRQAVPARGARPVDAEKLERYYRSREALGLSLEDEHGRVISTSVIHIEDYSSSRGGIEVEVLIADRDYWSRRTVG